MDHLQHFLHILFLSFIILKPLSLQMRANFKIEFEN